jgi:cell wall-associated NlpC family hydrolase
MVTAAHLLACARAYLGVPFVHHGRSPAGLDCFGLVLLACRDAGLFPLLHLPEDFDVCAYGRLPSSYQLPAHLDAYVPQAPRHPLQPGLLAVFAVSSEEPAHMGLLSESNGSLGLIHAWNGRVASRARVQEHRLSSLWRRRLWRAYQLPVEARPWLG